MGFFFSFSTNDPERLRCAIEPWREALRAPTRGDGWGLGFYQGDEVLLKRSPVVTRKDLDFYDLARDLRTDVLLGAVRQAAVGPRHPESTQPFRFRQWMGVHAGAVARFDVLRDELLASTPDFLRRNIRGRSDSEHLFHLVLAFLHDSGKLDRPGVAATDAAESVRAAVSFVDRAAAARAVSSDEAPSPITLALTNGRLVVALRRGRPLSVLRRNGIADCATCRRENAALGRDADRPVAHEQLRSVLLVSAPHLPRHAGGEEVSEGTIVMVDSSLSVTTQAAGA